MTPKPAPAWHAEARRLIDGGMPVAQACRAVNMSEHSVRFALDINDCKARTVERTRKRRQALKENPGLAKTFRSPMNHVTSKNAPRDRSGIKGYLDKPEPIGITLPKVSIQTVAEEERTYRIVTRCEMKPAAPGAERWRAAHLSMMRRGMIVSSDVVSEMRQ